jgi:hypothetical protein
LRRFPSISALIVFGCKENTDATKQSAKVQPRLQAARSELETARVFAGLLAVILIGLIVEAVIFRFVERQTVQRWGMQQ